MNISESLIKKCHASEKIVKKGDVIFSKGDPAEFYYQIKKGRVKMLSHNDEGREFIQGFFAVGQSFGEPPMLITESYPASAQAVEDTILYKCPKNDFFKLIESHPELHLRLTRLLAKRIHVKAQVLDEVSIQTVEHRLLAMIHFFTEKGKIFPYSRQELADMTGLRIETVIRAVKKLERKGDITIVKGKVYL